MTPLDHRLAAQSPVAAMHPRHAREFLVWDCLVESMRVNGRPRTARQFCGLISSDTSYDVVAR
jgi:hypothetical protein